MGLIGRGTRNIVPLARLMDFVQSILKLTICITNRSTTTFVSLDRIYYFKTSASNGVGRGRPSLI